MTPASMYTKRWKQTPKGAASVERYEKSAKGIEMRRRARQAWKKRNYARILEHNRVLHKVLYAVRTGRLERHPCVECGELRVQGHHHNGYGPGHELDVICLCPRHHRLAHDR